MNSRTPVLSVIVVNTNSRELVCRCLDSILQHEPRCEFEVIVVDNASTDGSCETIEGRFPGVRLLRNEQNLGFARANNLALEVARGSYLLLLNSDTVVQEGNFECMLQAVRADARVGIVSPRLVYDDGSLQHSYNPMPNMFVAVCTFLELRRLVPRSLLVFLRQLFGGRLLGKTVGTYADWLGQERLASRELGPDVYVTGACMLIRRGCYEQVGGLDPQFFMYVEDADYSKRVHDAGWKILYVAETTVVHSQGGTVGRRYRFESAPAYQSMLYFMKKHQGAWVFYVSKSFAVAAILGRWLVHFVVHDRSARKQTWALLKEVVKFQAHSEPTTANRRFVQFARPR